jgi:spermidine/putrescine transport system substrate-binding protein
MQDRMAISRRRLLHLTGIAGATAFLAASRVSAQDPSAPDGGLATSGAFSMASWIGYMPTDDTGTFWPDLDRFTAETGVGIDYQEVIEDNEGFYASDLQPALSSNVPTGWDLVVLSDWLVRRLAGLGWLEHINTAAMTNYPSNLDDIYAGPSWDPDNTLAAPYQAGMTGIGFDLARTGELTNLDVLFSDQFAGQVSYQSEMQDTIGLSALRLGFDPATLTREQFDASLAEVRTAVESDIVRPISGTWYVEEMTSGDAVVAMAWSGDILTFLVPAQDGDQDFQWRLPDQGGMIWTDVMVVPKGAANKAQAETFINWYYDPANAAVIAAFVNYVCPVKGARDAMTAIDQELADNPLIFPTEEMRQRLHGFVALPPEEDEAWREAYHEAVGE